MVLYASYTSHIVHAPVMQKLNMVVFPTTSGVWHFYFVPRFRRAICAGLLGNFVQFPAVFDNHIVLIW